MKTLESFKELMNDRYKLVMNKGNFLALIGAVKKEISYYTSKRIPVPFYLSIVRDELVFSYTKHKRGNNKFYYLNLSTDTLDDLHNNCDFLAHGSKNTFFFDDLLDLEQYSIELNEY